MKDNIWKQELRDLFFDEVNYPNELLDVEEIFYLKLEKFVEKQKSISYQSGKYR